MCPSQVRWPIPALPAVALVPIPNSNRFRCYCTTHESTPAFKTLHRGLSSPIYTVLLHGGLYYKLLDRTTKKITHKKVLTYEIAANRGFICGKIKKDIPKAL